MNVRRFYSRKNWTVIPASGENGESDGDHFDESDSDDEYVPPPDHHEIISTEISTSDTESGKQMP